MCSRNDFFTQDFDDTPIADALDSLKQQLIDKDSLVERIRGGDVKLDS